MLRDIDEELVRTFSHYRPDLGVMRRLISDGANINARDKDGFSVLWHAVASHTSRRAVVELLVACGADLDQEKDYLLYTACETIPLSVDAPDIIAFLLSKGANPNVMVDPGKLTILDVVEHFQSCYLKWSKEGREVSLECLEQVSAIVKLLVASGAKRAKEIPAASI